jgi:hypothetical protein
MFFSNGYFQCSKYCPTILENVVLHVQNRNFREFSLCNVEFESTDCPSARCAPTTNAIDSDNGIFIR